MEQQFITEYFLDNETNAAQADFLARRSSTKATTGRPTGS